VVWGYTHSMTLASHGVVGAGVAALFVHEPALGLTAAFVSHFLADAVPHWDYAIYSKESDENDPLETDMYFGRAFALDMLRIGADFFLGLAAAALIFSFFLGLPLWFALLGAFLGQLPDPLQFAYFKLRRQPLITLQTFHQWMHADKRPFLARPFVGIVHQISIVGIFSVLVMLFLRGSL
jgi:hypothetical protein